MPKSLAQNIYYVSAENDRTVLIAMDISVEDTWIIWFDTIKERRMEAGEIIDKDPQHFVFKRSDREGGGTYTFVPMTLDIYNKEVRRHTLIPQEFTDVRKLWNALRETKRHAW